MESEKFVLKLRRPSSRHYLLRYEGEDREVPAEKVEELVKILGRVTEDFWYKYFNGD